LQSQFLQKSIFASATKAHPPNYEKSLEGLNDTIEEINLFAQLYTKKSVFQRVKNAADAVSFNSYGGKLRDLHRRLDQSNADLQLGLAIHAEIGREEDAKAFQASFAASIQHSLHEIENSKSATVEAKEALLTEIKDLKATMGQYLTGMGYSKEDISDMLASLANSTNQQIVSVDEHITDLSGLVKKSFDYLLPKLDEMSDLLVKIQNDNLTHADTIIRNERIKSIRRFAMSNLSFEDSSLIARTHDHTSVVIASLDGMKVAVKTMQKYK